MPIVTGEHRHSYDTRAFLFLDDFHEELLPSFDQWVPRLLRSSLIARKRPPVRPTGVGGPYLESLLQRACRLLASCPFDQHLNPVETFACSNEECAVVFSAEAHICRPTLRDVDLFNFLTFGTENRDALAG